MKLITGRNEVITLTIALTISFVLWVYANLSQNPEIIKVIKVVPQYNNIPTGFQIGKLRKSIDIYVSGKRINLIKAINTGLNLYRVTYDLSDIVAGENKVKPIINEMFSLNFKVVRTSPELQTIIADRVIERELLVTNTWSGKPAKGYYVSERSTSPTIVKVKGLEKNILRVLYIEGEKNIDLNGLSEDKVFPLILYAFNDKHEKIDNVTIYPQRVICSVAIKKFEKKNVPIILKLRNNVARGYELTYSNIIPENIDIYGPKTKVDKAGPFYVNHSLNNLKKDFEVDKILKCKEEDELCFKGYKSTSSYKIQLNVREKQLEKKFFKLPLNSIFNQNKDFFYRIDTPATVDVRITGPELLVDGVFSSEVIPYIDVNNSLEGDWTMTIETKLPKGIKLIRLYPNNAKITIVKNLDKDNK